MWWGGFGFPVAPAEGKRPVPSRTRKLSPPAPMVLRPTGRGRVGHRRNTQPPPPTPKPPGTPPGGFRALRALRELARSAPPSVLTGTPRRVVHRVDGAFPRPVARRRTVS